MITCWCGTVFPLQAACAYVILPDLPIPCQLVWFTVRGIHAVTRTLTHSAVHHVCQQSTKGVQARACT